MVPGSSPYRLWKWREAICLPVSCSSSFAQQLEKLVHEMPCKSLIPGKKKFIFLSFLQL